MRIEAELILWNCLREGMSCREATALLEHSIFVDSHKEITRTLEKWVDQGCYEYGVSLYAGWIPHAFKGMPKRLEEYTQEKVQIPHRINRCKYEQDYTRKCDVECSGDYCARHLKEKCISCGQQATHNCCYCGQFVCGHPLCDDCEGWEDHTKPSGSWGFLNHSHRKKVE